MPVLLPFITSFYLNIPFLIENVLNTREGLNPGYVNRSDSSFNIAFGAVQVFRILILSVLALHVNLM